MYYCLKTTLLLALALNSHYKLEGILTRKIYCGPFFKIYKSSSFV